VEPAESLLIINALYRPDLLEYDFLTKTEESGTLHPSPVLPVSIILQPGDIVLPGHQNHERADHLEKKNNTKDREIFAKDGSDI